MKRIPTFDGLRREIRSRWPEWTALSLYVALLAIAIPYHEPSADVAQAWQLARCLSLRDLFLTYIRYEGSPGLWHFLLWILIRARVSYTGLPWICGVIAIGAAALLVFKSPFPRYLKLVMPFTVFLLFQYAVVARSYVLVPILLFLAAFWWQRSPVVLALLLGLLANVALHATVISGGIAVIYVIEQVSKKGINQSTRWRQFSWSALILLSFSAFALWTAWPPRDLTDYMSFRLHSSAFLFLLRAAGSLVWAVFDPWALSLPFWIAIALCFRRRRSLFYLLPVLFLAVFCGVVASDWWHCGLMAPLVVCLLWITWPPASEKLTHSETAGRIALTVMAGMQILYSGYAIQYDHDNAYSPDYATSEFLRPFVSRGAAIAVTDLGDHAVHAASFFSVGVLPYFDHNIFINVPDSFWLWSDKNVSAELYKKYFPSHPDLVIVGVYSVGPDNLSFLSNPGIQMLDHAGYKFTNMFCGAMPEGFRLANHNCDLIFQRAKSPQGTVLR
jgi:hypothetical protein